MSNSEQHVAEYLKWLDGSMIKDLPPAKVRGKLLLKATQLDRDATAQGRSEL